MKQVNYGQNAEAKEEDAILRASLVGDLLVVSFTTRVIRWLLVALLGWTLQLVTRSEDLPKSPKVPLKIALSDNEFGQSSLDGLKILENHRNNVAVPSK